MKTNIKNTLAVVALALGSSVFAANSYAVGITGSGTLGAAAAPTYVVGTDLSNFGTLNINLPFFSSGLGDMTNVGFTFLAPDPLVLTISGTAVTAFSTITGPANFGTFTPNLGASFVVSKSANFMDLYIEGLLTPGTGVGTQAGGCAPTCDPTEASMRISFTQTGASLSYSGTFASPAAPPQLPEPASLSLLGIGMIGWAANRRKAAK